MSTDLLYFVVFLALLFRFRAASQSSSARARERAERERILEMYAEFEAHLNGRVKQALRMIDGHFAAETQHADSELSIFADEDFKKLEVTSGELLRRVGNVEEILSTLFEVAWWSGMIGLESGDGELKQVNTVANRSVTLSCNPGGQVWEFCEWRNPFTQNQYKNPFLITKGHGYKLNGIEHTPGNLSSAGNCDLHIASVQQTHDGPWSCTILFAGGHTFVPVTTIFLRVFEMPLFLYFIEVQRGVMAYSLILKTTVQVVKNSDLNGITHDFRTQRLYWCSNSTIFRAQLKNGSYAAHVQTLYTITTIGPTYGLAFDWITNNLYGVSQGGHIFACKETSNGTFDCYTLRDDQGNVNGIAINPNEGTMYWTGSDRGGWIKRGNMNGWGVKIVKSRLGAVFGITLHVNTDHLRLFWANSDLGLVQSINLYGRGGKTLTSRLVKNVTTDPDVGVYGICMANATLYWSNSITGKLQTGVTHPARLHRKTLYTTAGAGMRHLTSSWLDLVANRTNPCSTVVVMNCSGICVLSGDSFACVDRKL